MNATSGPLGNHPLASQQVDHYRDPIRVRVLAEATLPLVDGDLRFLVYGPEVDVEEGTEEVVVLLHEPEGTGQDAALVRIHSVCLTGDVFGSQKCDCGAQLGAALHQIQQAPRGALLYMLGHEGRGIGLVNKIRAYKLQDEGLDTISANLALGLPVDARDYALAAGVLLHLHMAPVDVLTNNPTKIQALLEHGVTVRSRVPLNGFVTLQNAEYLGVKDDHLGHLGAAHPARPGSRVRRVEEDDAAPGHRVQWPSGSVLTGRLP